MDKVHTADRELAKFHLAIIAKKWYFPLPINGLNIGLAYAWCLSQISEKKSVLQKDFLRVGVQILLKAAVIKYICEWEGLKSASAHPEVRLNNVYHFP